MRRRSFLASVVLAATAGCTGSRGPETRDLDAKRVASGDGALAFFDGDDRIAGIEIGVDGSDSAGRTAFAVEPSITDAIDQLIWSSLLLTFTFPGVDGGPHLYHRIDSDVGDATVVRREDGATVFGVTEEVRDLPPMSFEAAHESDGVTEMAVAVDAELVRLGTPGTEYVGSGTVSVELG